MRVTRPSGAGERRLLPEIQALRAVAVTLVVVFHVWPNALPGGYVGVDAFFVISGYLITAHLARERMRTGRISLSRFWARRIRRLLPSAFVVLGACTVALFVLLPEVLLREGLRQIAASAVYVLNWVLAVDAVDYLAAENSATLVQHYWTLGVEEQFYLLWPLLLVVGCALVARRVPPAVALVSVVVGAASFWYSVTATARNPAFTFFDTGARVWEFAVGALLAALVLQSPGRVAAVRRAPAFRTSGLLPVTGFALLILAAFTYDAATPFPGTAALLPVVGAALIILGGHVPGTWWTRALSVRPVQYLGRISYEVYLWHWPLVVGLLVSAGRPPTAADGALLILATLVLAAALQATVTVGTRWAGRLWQRRRTAYAFAAVGAVVFVGLSWTTAVRLDREAAAVVAAARAAAAADPDSCVGANATLGPSAAYCDDRFRLDPEVDLTAAALDLDTKTWCLTWFTQEWISCEAGEVDDPVRTVALVGDSHGASLKPALEEYSAERGIRLITYLRFGCNGEAHQGTIDTSTEAGTREQACRDWSDRVRAEIVERDDIDAVLWTGNDISYLRSGSVTPADVRQVWDQVGDSGKRIVVLRGVPSTTGEPVPECLASAPVPQGPCAVPRSEALAPSVHRQVLDAGYVGDVHLIDLSDAYCDDDRCYSVIGGVVVYADNNHLSGTWTRSLMTYLGPALDDALG